MVFVIPTPFQINNVSEIRIELSEPITLEKLISMQCDRIFEHISNEMKIRSDQMFSNFLFFRNGNRIVASDVIANENVIEVHLMATGG